MISLSNISECVSIYLDMLRPHVLHEYVLQGTADK